MNTQTLRTNAARLVSAFEDATRPDGSTYVRVIIDHPEADEALVLVRATHGEGDSMLLPVDTLFEMVRDTLNRFADLDDDEPDDTFDEIPDGLVPDYTRDLLAWLADDPLALDYCDDAAREYGWVNAVNTLEVIQQGYYQRVAEVVGIVRAALETKQAEVQA